MEVPMNRASLPERNEVSELAVFLVIVLMASHHLQNKIQFCVQHAVLLNTTLPTWLAQFMAIFLLDTSTKMKHMYFL